MTDTSALRPRTGWRDIWSWYAPWIVGTVIAAIFLFGLYTTSRANDDGSYAIGFILAGAALAGLAYELWAGFPIILPTVLVDTAEGLAVVVFLLGALAIGGLILAATSPDADLHSVGYALFVVCAVLIGWNLKHYYDRRDRDSSIR